MTSATCLPHDSVAGAPLIKVSLACSRARGASGMAVRPPSPRKPRQPRSGSRHPSRRWRRRHQRRPARWCCDGPSLATTRQAARCVGLQRSGVTRVIDHVAADDARSARRSHPDEQPANPGKSVLVADDLRHQLVLRIQPAQPLPDQQPLTPAEPTPTARSTSNIQHDKPSNPTHGSNRRAAVSAFRQVASTTRDAYQISFHAILSLRTRGNAIAVSIYPDSRQLPDLPGELAWVPPVPHPDARRDRRARSRLRDPQHRNAANLSRAASSGPLRNIARPK